MEVSINSFNEPLKRDLPRRSLALRDLRDEFVIGVACQ
jgi:hypothetical protein